MAWYDTPEDYAVPGVAGLLPPMPPSQVAYGSPYSGLLGSAPNQDVALAIAALGAGLASGRGRTRGEAWGSGLQQGMTGLLGTATLSGRQKALQQEVNLREEDARMRAQQMALTQAEMQRKQAAIAKLAEQYPQLAPLLNAGLGAELFKPQKVGPGEMVGIPAMPGAPLLQGQPKPPEASPIAKLLQERDALPVESPLRQTYDAAIQKAITVTPPASVTVGFQSPLAVETPQGPRFVMPPNKPGGTPQILEIPGMGPALPPPKAAEKPSDTERTAAGYHDRMSAAEAIISQIGQAGIPSYTTSAAGVLGGGGLVGQVAEGVIMTPEQQQYRQAQEDWVRAKLRKESGAVINKDEMRDEIKTYFPQPYDKPETIAQKARSRAVAVDAMRQQSGTAKTRTSQPVAVTNDAEYNALPSGAVFVGPDGKTRRKP